MAAAAAIWALVATEPELSTFASAQVEYKNLPDDMEIDSNPLATVMLELRGPSGALRDIGEASLRPQVILDMSTAAPGQRTFTIEDGIGETAARRTAGAGHSVASAVQISTGAPRPAYR